MLEICKTLLYKFAYWTLGVLMVFTHGLRINGRTRIPRTGPVLLIGNHTSFLDIILAGLSCQRQVFFLARKTLARNKLLAFIMRLSNTIQIDQEGFSRAGLQGAAEALMQNRVVVVFPEGERCRDGNLGRFKPGISLLLRTYKGPVVPFGLAGAFETWPRSRWWPRFAPPFLDWRPQRIGVFVGAPIPPECYSDLPRAELLEFLRAKVNRCVEAAERLRRPLAGPQ